MDYDFSDFVAAYDKYNETAINDLRSSAKKGHWVWFVFPQPQELSQFNFYKG